MTRLWDEDECPKEAGDQRWQQPCHASGDIVTQHRWGRSLENRVDVRPEEEKAAQNEEDCDPYVEPCEEAGKHITAGRAREKADVSQHDRNSRDRPEALQLTEEGQWLQSCHKPRVMG